MKRNVIRGRNRGESLIETMFALLVGSMSVMLLATMISASAKLIRLGEENADVYTANLNQMNEARTNGTDATVKIQFYRHGDGGPEDILFDNFVFDEIKVKTTSFRDGNRAPVVAYEKDTGNT